MIHLPITSFPPYLQYLTDVFADSDSEDEPQQPVNASAVALGASDPKEWEHLRQSDPVLYAVKMRCQRPVPTPNLKCTGRNIRRLHIALICRYAFFAVHNLPSTGTSSSNLVY